MTVLPAVLTATLFFLIVPAIGVLISRSRWRSFRNSMQQAALKPCAGHNAIREAHSGSPEIGEYRFFGTLEALQADDRIWVRDGESSVEVDMTGTSVVLLPEQPPPSAMEGIESERFESMLYSMASPERIPWKQMTSLTEGTRVFVCGKLESDNGVPVFRGMDRGGPLVVLYDGPAGELLSRAIWYGRHRNEYWNFLTPLSLIAGMLVLVILALGEFSSSGSYGSGILTLGLASIPVLPLLPPGVMGYFAYRRLWMKGRARRAWRDLLRLPLLYWESRDHETQMAELPDGETYVSVSANSQEVNEYLQRGAVLRQGPSKHDEQGWTVFGKPAGESQSGAGAAGGAHEAGDNQAGESQSGAGAAGGAHEAGDNQAGADSATDNQAGAGLVRPRDPMAELVVLPWEPARRSKRSAILAYVWETCALVVLAISILLNFTLFVRALPLVI